MREKMGLPVNHYVPIKSDVPAARFMFMKLCKDQSAPVTGSTYPEVIEKAGIEFPSEG